MFLVRLLFFILFCCCSCFHFFYSFFFSFCRFLCLFLRPLPSVSFSIPSSSSFFCFFPFSFASFPPSFLILLPFLRYLRFCLPSSLLSSSTSKLLGRKISQGGEQDGRVSNHCAIVIMVRASKSGRERSQMSGQERMARIAEGRKIRAG